MNRIIMIFWYFLATQSMANENIITILVGFPPGGGNYIVAQTISDAANKLGYTNKIDIKAGAGGIIGMNDCVNRVDDRNLICIVSQAQYAHSVSLSPDIRKFDPATLTYIKMIGSSPTVLVTSPKNPQGIDELLDDILKNKRVSFGVGALGLKVFTNWFLIQSKSSSESIMVDYKGVGPAIIDILGGHIDYAFVPYATVHSQVAAGTLKIIATAGDTTGSPYLSSLPHIQKFVPSMENDTTMFGFVMGPGVEKDIIEKYNMILTKVLQAPNVKESLELQGILVSDPLSESSHFTKFAHEERIRLIQQLKAMPPQ